MPEDDECVSTSAASPFYTPPGRHPFGQVVRWRLGKVRTEPSSALRATSTLPGRQPFGQVVPWRFAYVWTDPSSALSTTLSGQQPFGQVVRWRFAHVWTDPSSSLSCKRRGHAPLIARSGLHHQPSWTRHLLHTQHVANASDRVPIPFLSRRCCRPLGDRGSNGESLAFQSSFYVLAGRPCHPAPRLPLGARPRPDLDGTG